MKIIILSQISYFILYELVQIYCKKTNIGNLDSSIKIYIDIIYTIYYYILHLNISGEIELINHLFLLFLLTISTITDLNYMIVPDSFHIMFTPIIFILSIYRRSIRLVIESIVLFIALYLVYILCKDKLGGADVKIYINIALTIGIYKSIKSIFLASQSALIFILIRRLLKNEKIDKKEEIPFIPYILIGVMLTYL